MTKQEIQAAIEKAVAGYRENTEREIRKFNNGATAKLAGRGEFSINTIEEIRGDILHSNKKVTEELINEVSNGITEKELIVKEVYPLGGIVVASFEKRTHRGSARKSQGGRGAKNTRRQ
jgi:hypothetical protein